MFVRRKFVCRSKDVKEMPYNFRYVACPAVDCDLNLTLATTTFSFALLEKIPGRPKIRPTEERGGPRPNIAPRFYVVVVGREERERKREREKGLRRVATTDGRIDLSEDGA